MTNRELLSFEDFRRARLNDSGFMVITDSARPPIVHRLNGKCVSAENFRTKVVVEQRASGTYYLVDTVSSGVKELGASVCKVCKPLKADKEPWKS